MKILWVLAFLVVAAVPARAADADAEYKALIESSYAMPADFDFMRARELYVKREGFSPYGTMVKADFQPFFRMAEQRNDAVAEQVTAYAFENFPLMEVHASAIPVFMKLADEEKIAYHKWAAEGTAKAMKASGDATSKATAMKVVNVSEEYLFARQFGDTQGQRLHQEDGRVYDVLNVKPKDGGDMMEMWFDITDVFGKGIP
jgi:hypothetical protein